MTSREPLTKGLYSNCVMQTPEGEFMCYMPEKKMRWYLKKDLADVVDEKTIKLKFQPKGKGHNGDAYYSEQRQNDCVICGCETDLSKHHVVPYQYRKHFPKAFSSHTHFDVVMVCNGCHDTYETLASLRNKELCDKYDVPMHYHQGDEASSEMSEVYKYAYALHNHEKNMPEKRKKLLYKKLSGLLDYDVQEVHLSDICAECKEQSNGDCATYKYAEKIIEKVPDILEFMVEWRQHFIDTMNPQNLSQSWLDSYKTRER